MPDERNQQPTSGSRPPHDEPVPRRIDSGEFTDEFEAPIDVTVPETATGTATPRDALPAQPRAGGAPAQQGGDERSREWDARAGRIVNTLAQSIGSPGQDAAAKLVESPVLRRMLPPDRDNQAAPLPQAADLHAVAKSVDAAHAKYNDRVFKFGIVGFQSSGKSYLISALFDRMNFLPSLDEATTSVVTRIRYPAPGESMEQIEVLFHTEPGKREFCQFLDRLNQSDRAAHPVRYEDQPGTRKITAQFADKEVFLRCDNPRRDLQTYRRISEVHIRQASPFLTDSTEIIDLPGLGGPYALLDETTLSYLDEVDAVLFISSINHNWVKTDTELFQRLAGRPNVLKKVFFVLSKVDMPGSNVQKSIGTFHNLLDEFVSPDIPKDRIYYASAWMALADHVTGAGQKKNLENTAHAFETQDPHSFFEINNPDLMQRLSGAFTPGDGGMHRLRSGLYDFFTNHKRLLQLNEVLHSLADDVTPFATKLRNLTDAATQGIGPVASGGNRETQWLVRHFDDAFTEAHHAFAAAIDNLNRPPFGIAESWWQTAVRQALREAVADAQTTDEPDLPRERRAWIEAVTPRIAERVASDATESIMEQVSEFAKRPVQDRLDPTIASFAEPLQEQFDRIFRQFDAYVYAAVRTQLGPICLAECRPSEGAAIEYEPFRETYIEVTAEALYHAVLHAGELFGVAWVAAWDTLRQRCRAWIRRDVADFYKANPDAAKPMVESPEGLLGALERLTDEVATQLSDGRALNEQIARRLAQ